MPETDHGYLVMRHIPVNLESLTRAVATSPVSPVSTLPGWDAAVVRSVGGLASARCHEAVNPRQLLWVKSGVSSVVGTVGDG